MAPKENINSKEPHGDLYEYIKDLSKRHIAKGEVYDFLKAAREAGLVDPDLRLNGPELKTAATLYVLEQNLTAKGKVELLRQIGLTHEAIGKFFWDETQLGPNKKPWTPPQEPDPDRHAPVSRHSKPKEEASFGEDPMTA